MYDIKNNTTNNVKIVTLHTCVFKDEHDPANHSIIFYRPHQVECN